MALGYGSKITTRGLVFAYDMASKQSWKGKPVENLVPSGQRTCSSSLTRQGWHVDSYNYSLTSIDNRKDVIKVTLNPTTTTGTLPYADFGFQTSRSGGSQVGDVYWVSFEYKNVKGGDVPDFRIAYANGYKDPSSANVATVTDVTTTDLPYGWKRRTHKVTLSAAGNTWWRFGQNSNGENTEFYLDNFQIIYSDVDAPFVDGTRSNTESIIDWKGKNVITTNSLTYNNDNTFTFDGANQNNFCSITPNSRLSSIRGSTSITVEAWVYYTSYSGGSQPYSVITVWGSPWTWLLENPSGGKLRFRITAGGSDVNIQDPDVHPLNQWIHVVGTYDGSTKKIYINGELKNSSSQTGSLASPSGTPKIGTFEGSNYNFSGDISSVKIYDVSLTEREIKQNFLAAKGRFGL